MSAHWWQELDEDSTYEPEPVTIPRDAAADERCLATIERMKASCGGSEEAKFCDCGRKPGEPHRAGKKFVEMDEVKVRRCRWLTLQHRQRSDVSVMNGALDDMTILHGLDSINGIMARTRAAMVDSSRAAAEQSRTARLTRAFGGKLEDALGRSRP